MNKNCVSKASVYILVKLIYIGYTAMNMDSGKSLLILAVIKIVAGIDSDSNKTFQRDIEHAAEDRQEWPWSPDKCYEELGCFGTRLFAFYPQDPKVLKTRFLVNSRSNPHPNSSSTIDYLDDVKNPKKRLGKLLKKTSPVKIIVHGLNGRPDFRLYPEMTEALLKRFDVNVVRVDWSIGAQGADWTQYPQAAANTQIVGAQIAIFIQRLVERFGMRLDQFHIIGHSLGAHVAGYAGAKIAETKIRGEERKISRITGLDPAEPLFEFHGVGLRLDPSDADFVDVIHTDGESIWWGIIGGTANGYGMAQPCGHKDFYPNGGASQPGCNAERKLLLQQMRRMRQGAGAAENPPVSSSSSSTSSSSSSTSSARRMMESCDHDRSQELFLATILETGCRFVGRRCKDWEHFKGGHCDENEEEVMGIDASPPDSPETRMKVYLKTGGENPFCLGDEGARG